jgi:hypothetical protein
VAHGIRLGQDGSKRPAQTVAKRGGECGPSRKLKITAEPFPAVVIVGWLAVFALALLWTP